MFHAVAYSSSGLREERQGCKECKDVTCPHHSGVEFLASWSLFSTTRFGLPIAFLSSTTARAAVVVELHPVADDELSMVCKTAGSVMWWIAPVGSGETTTNNVRVRIIAAQALRGSRPAVRFDNGVWVSYASSRLMATGLGTTFKGL
jgi:hypothetical protein